jgi:hypothetical protein
MKKRRKVTKDEAGTDTALHEQEMKADTKVPAFLMEKLRKLAVSLGISPEVVKR